jgi:nucleotide-binding universal stress UspA family protein
VTSTLGLVDVTDGTYADPSATRPVLLATLDAPLLAEASRMAVEAAVEAGQPLLIVNAVETTLSRLDLTFGYVATPAVEESLNEPALLARALGVRTRRFCLRSPRPVDALLEFASDREVGLLALGPDPEAMRRRRYRRCVGKIREQAPCLVWVA